MEKLILVLVFLLFVSLSISAQTLEISGKLFDKDGNAVIRKGIVLLSPDNLTATVDQTGGYSFTTSPAGISFWQMDAVSSYRVISRDLSHHSTLRIVY